MVLGNFLAAVLVRNEVFGRILYAIVNNCFAKVCSHLHNIQSNPPILFPVASASVSPGMYIHTAAPWRHPFWMRGLRFNLANHQRRRRFPQSKGEPRTSTRHGYYHESCHRRCDERSIPLG
jgi:hypothetical protein